MVRHPQHKVSQMRTCHYFISCIYFFVGIGCYQRSKEIPPAASASYWPLSNVPFSCPCLTHTHTARVGVYMCIVVHGWRGVSVLASLIHFTPHWSETCDCGSGLCLFLTPWESTGVRGHMQEAHAQTSVRTHTHARASAHTHTRTQLNTLCDL